MRYVRFLTPRGPSWGFVDGDVIRAIDGPPYSVHQQTGQTQLLRFAKLLAPVTPSKIVGVGLNYAAWTKVYPNLKLPTEPIFFYKVLSALTNPDEPIQLTSLNKEVIFEAEMAMVIGKTARRVREAEALDYVFGVTIVNDVTDLGLITQDGNNLARGKCFDTFCPAGPYLVTDLNPSQLAIRSRLNGQEKQRFSTAEMLFSAQKVITALSQVMTLYPGDLIHTGTPPGPEPLKPGDVVEIEVEGVGTLRNPVVVG
jgi:2-keto-4-pentenoate hydratase/2-oxohepta-3-ene-1,7-dioic acid hydratase in catechol pathway